jgi:hypothetical protein
MQRTTETRILACILELLSVHVTKWVFRYGHTTYVNMEKQKKTTQYTKMYQEHDFISCSNTKRNGILLKCTEVLGLHPHLQLHVLSGALITSIHTNLWESVDMQENAKLGVIKNLNVGRMCTNCCHDLQTQMTHKKRDFLEFICLQIYQPSGDGCKSFK